MLCLTAETDDKMTNSNHNIVSSFLPFPNILWWVYVNEADSLCFDGCEHFQKMSYRNRYYISGSNGMIQLSIPLEQGRNQRTVMKDVRISNDSNWQTQHWRTLVSVYRRSPFFEHYEPELQLLYETRYEFLCQFNMASINWVKKQIGARFEISETEAYLKEYENTIDLRTIRPGIEKKNTDDAIYYQVFADRIGFLRNLSIVDLLFSEGPAVKNWIKLNRTAILQWQG